MFGQDRHQIRQLFFDVWSKMQTDTVLTGLEQTLANVIANHPEYQSTLTHPNNEQEFFVEQGETNPFLHMGLHIALHEQLSTNRPAGIQQVYQTLLQQTGKAHETEHQMMDCLAEAIWLAQQNNQVPSEVDYLHALQALVRK
jgi:hypothetical protein